MTRFEKIMQDLTLEKMAEHLDDTCDSTYCKAICEKHTGDKYKSYEGKENCLKCAVEYLSEEVE